MEGDPRNPQVSLLKKYDIPIEHLSYEYVERCYNKKELERIIRILRSGEEGSYPDLLKVAEEQLRLFAPESRVLRIETPILTKECLTKEEWDAMQSELLSWEEEMHIMDKSLDFEKGRIEVVQNKNLPDIRKVVEPPPKSKPEGKSKAVKDSNNKNNNNYNKNNSNSNSNSNSNRRIKSGDYGAWDKYDVDKELLKMDVEEERKQEEKDKKKREIKKLEKEKRVEVVDIDKENYSSMEQQILANQAKDRGNECYKSGDLETALKYYKISIKLHSTANAYNNRAMTYLKLKQYENALKDCNSALHLEKNNVKALYRRATAYQNMPDKKENDKYEQLALKDLQQIITLEPNNKAAQSDLQKLKKKLHIEDSGKKFRMPISEGFINNRNPNQTEEKSSVFNGTDNLLNERLPLTYYGPSTSTFQCEPYSMVHRALLGSSITGQVLCKCNSNRSRQNPLCQRCGEAMCTPKPSKVVSTQVKPTTKKENETKNLLLEQQTNKIVKVDSRSSNLSNDVLSVKSKEAGDTKNGSALNSTPMSEVNDENYLKQEAKYVGIENSKNSERNNNPSDINELGYNKSTISHVSKKSVDLPENCLTVASVRSDNSENEKTNSETCNKKITETQVQKLVSKETKSLNNEIVKTAESVCPKNSVTKITENSSSQGDVNHNSKKSKNKKKKSKEHKDSKPMRKHLEPVKVVHAEKYLHPTSVEPKIRNETEQRREPSFSNIQYKAFVANRRSYSTEYLRMDSATVTPPASLPKKLPFSVMGDKVSNDTSYEGNKENILENSCIGSVENERREGDDVKREIFDSAFEFIKTWEELKKFDESYIKRAEIIHKIRPGDLSKVIGIMLDSDMLSCLLECLSRHLVETDPKRVVELLKQLPQVPRFGLVSMFLTDADKKKILTLIDTAEGKGFKIEEEVKKNLTMNS